MDRPEPADPASERPLTPDGVRSLVESHREFLGFVERRVGSRAVAEDILQEAFVRSSGRLDALGSEEALRAWFYRTLRNAVVDHHRRRTAEERRLEGFAAELLAREEADPELERVLCSCVVRLADTLKPEYAEALRAVEVEGNAVKDFALRAGITENNAGVRLHRARQALRKQVARSCGTCAEHGCVDCTCGGPGHGESREESLAGP
jgi:RNA polymerase sigma factor (sigma-70 family)